jgi:Tfp pilus assembly protein PilX
MLLIPDPNDESGDRGSALMAVLGVAALMMIVGVAIASMAVTALGFTGTTRAGIQARTAAESGINVAVVALRNGTCSASANYSQASTPTYFANVSYSTADTGDTWVLNACPPYADQTVKRVKIVSTGTAKAQTAAGGTSLNQTSVEAIYPFTPAVRPGITPTGSAMYFYGTVSYKNNGNLIVAAGGPPAIQVANGDFGCDNGSVIQGDVVVAHGNLSIATCTIKGNVWASGTATLGTITGNLTAANLTRPTGVSGTYTTGGTIPVVPQWVSFSYDPALPIPWFDSTGTVYKRIPIGADCKMSVAMMNAVAVTGTGPVIIDAMACTAGVNASDSSVSLPNDIVVYAPKFNWRNNLTFKSSDSSQHRKLWFITPDITHTVPPTCNYALQGDFIINNSFAIDPTVDAMLYTPCQLVANNTFSWRGQIYANGSLNSFWNNTGFTYAGMGLPGVDLAKGTATTVSAAGAPSTLRTMASMRDVKLGG